MNLLKIKHIGGLFRAKWFPIVPQLFMLIVFILLVAGGLGVTTDDPDFTNWLRNTNLSNLVAWSYWWPVIIIAAIFLGRLWCTVCPVELITYWAAKIGLRQQVPLILKSGWVVTIFYTLIWIVGVHTLVVNRIPRQTALSFVANLLLQPWELCHSAIGTSVGDKRQLLKRLFGMLWIGRDLSGPTMSHVPSWQAAAFDFCSNPGAFW